MAESLQDPATAARPSLIENNDTQNSRSIVNRLPLELLSRIFILVEKFERNSRERSNKDPYLGIQDQATVAALYISRAGPSSLLDINVEAGSKYERGGEEGHIHGGIKEAFSNTLDSFLGSGASINRWRSLVVSTVDPEVLSEVFKVLPAHPTPALQTLSLYWDSLLPSGQTGWTPESDDDMDQFSLSHSSNASMPQLRSIELVHVPHTLLLRKPMFPLQQLTTLSYTAPTSDVFSAQELIAVVSACSSLESLSVGASSMFHPGLQLSKRVPLQSLRSLSVKAWDAEPAGQILALIDSPMLRALTISVNRTGSLVDRISRPGRAGNSLIAHYISLGRVHGGASNTTSRTPYPQLRELDISEVEFQLGDLAEIFAGLPSVTHLVLSKQQAWGLGKPPWPMPELASLRFPRGAHERFGEVLRRRSKAGFPIECIGLTSHWEARIGRDLRSWSRVEVIPGHPEKKKQTGKSEFGSDNEDCAHHDPYKYNKDWWARNWPHDDFVQPLDSDFAVPNLAVDASDPPDPSSKSD